MNATCPAGISQPQRVSDLGRLLDSEITAPLDSTPAGVVHPPAWRLLLCMAPPSAWRLPLYKAPSSMARALCKAPSSLALAICKAPSLTSAWRLPICKAPSPRHVRGSSSFPHGAPCVHQLPRWQFPHQVAFPKKRGFLSSRLSRCPTTRAARPVRHNAGGVFLRLRHASSPSCSTSNRPGSCPGSKVPNHDHAQTRRRRTTRLRVHVVMKVGRRSTKAQRAAFIDSQERPTCGRVLFSLEIFPLW